MRNKPAIVFLILSIVFALFAMPFSGALSQEKVDRTANLTITDDSNAVFGLQGFDRRTYNLNIKYKSFGTITNNTNRSIMIKASISADFSAISNKNCILGIQLGNETREFNQAVTNGQISISLAPGQSVDTLAMINQNQKNTIKLTFDFTATDSTGRYSMQLNDNLNTPRCIYLY